MLQNADIRDENSVNGKLFRRRFCLPIVIVEKLLEYWLNSAAGAATGHIEAAHCQATPLILKLWTSSYSTHPIRFVQLLRQATPPMDVRRLLILLLES